MVAINIEMPKNCLFCPLYVGKKGEGHCAITHKWNAVGGLNRLDDCLLVEIEERKVGKWIYKKLGVRTFGIVCSSCNRVYHEGQNIGSLEEFKKDIERIMRERNITLDEYCCHCGAEMVGVENGTTNN